jgi:signal transduction histidine kinase
MAATPMGEFGKVLLNTPQRGWPTVGKSGSMAGVTVEREGEFWPTRVAMLAELARVDALAVVLRPNGAAFVTYAAHNVSPGSSWSSATETSLLVVALDGSSVDGGVKIPLTDGRVAVAMRALPVVWNEHRIGALVGLQVNGPFDADTKTLERVAALIALELVEENTFWRIQRAAAELEARTKASSELQGIVRAERDPDAILERATSGLARVFGADGVSIMLVADDRLSVRSAIGLSDDARRETKRVGEGISGFVAQSGQALLLVGPVNGDRPFHGNDPTITDSMIAPLRNGDRTIGVVNVKHCGSGERFGAADLDALTAIGADIAATLSFVEAVSRSEDDRTQAIALYELSRLGSADADPEQELETAVAMLADVMHHDVVGLWIRDADGRAHRRASRGYGPDAAAEIAADAFDGAFARAIAGERVVAARIAPDAPIPAWAASAATEYVVAAVSAQGVVIGALVLGRAGAPYPEAEADFAATAAEYLFDLAHTPESMDEKQATAGERKRIAQELHDGLAQELTGVVLSLEGAQRAFERNPQLLGQQLAKATRDARATLADVRQYMGALRQDTAAGLGLPTTVARLIDDLRRQSGLAVDMQELGTERELSPDLERAVIRIVGEALRNVAQHAAAKSVTVTLNYGADAVIVTIADDGLGFDARTTGPIAESHGHFGLLGMRERAEAVGGTLALESAPGAGTMIIATVPYQASRAIAPRDDAPTAAPETATEAVPEAAPTRRGFVAWLFGE